MHCQQNIKFNRSRIFLGFIQITLTNSGTISYIISRLIFSHISIYHFLDLIHFEISAKHRFVNMNQTNYS